MTCRGRYDDGYTSIFLLSLEIMKRLQVFVIVVDLVEVMSCHILDDIRSYHSLTEMDSITHCLSLLLGQYRCYAI